MRDCEYDAGSPGAYPLTITSDGEDEDGQAGAHSGPKPSRATSLRQALQVSPYPWQGPLLCRNTLLKSWAGGVHFPAHELVW